MLDKEQHISFFWRQSVTSVCEHVWRRAVQMLTSNGCQWCSLPVRCICKTSINSHPSNARPRTLAPSRQQQLMWFLWSLELSARSTNDTGLQTMKKEIIDDMNTRFADVAAQPLYAVATLVDPRYRGKLFSQSEFATAKQWIVDAVDAVHCWIQLETVQLQSTRYPVSTLWL